MSRLPTARQTMELRPVAERRMDSAKCPRCARAVEFPTDTNGIVIETCPGCGPLRHFAGRSTAVPAPERPVVDAHGGRMGQRKSRAKRLDERAHGLTSTYNAGCRCPECKAAKAESNRKDWAAYRDRKRARRAG